MLTALQKLDVSFNRLGAMPDILSLQLKDLNVRILHYSLAHFSLDFWQPIFDITPFLLAEYRNIICNEMASSQSKRRRKSEILHQWKQSAPRKVFDAWKQQR